MLWLCGDHSLRIHITGGIWMWPKPKQGLTAISELSRSQIETNMISIASFFALHFQIGGLPFVLHNQFQEVTPPPTSLRLHQPQLLATAILSSSFPRYSESCQYPEDLLDPRLCVKITTTNISYRLIEEGTQTPGNWTCRVLKSLKNFPVIFQANHSFK